MPREPEKRARDRIQIHDDEKKQVVDLADFQVQPPTVGVFDTPKRCYPLNNEWAKYIFGMILWLSEVTSWELSTDEGYQAIQDILEFTVGEECMDCDGVEACLSTSAIIASLQSQITANLNAIADNDTDIANNLAAIQGNATNIANLTNRMDTAETDILDLEGRVDANETQIANNLAAIIDHTALLVSHNTQIADHETRITALEAISGGGGGGGNIKVTTYPFERTASFDTSSNVYVAISQTAINHNFTMPNALVIGELRFGRVSGGGDYWWAIGYDTDVQINQARIDYSFGNRMVSQEILAIPAGSHTIQAYMKTAGSTVARCNIGEFMWTIIEYGDIAPENQALVTFDAGGHAYTIDDSGIVSNVGAGGNPDDCLRGYNRLVGDWFEVIIDIGSVEEITGIEWDAWSTNGPEEGFAVAVDGVWIYGTQLWGGPSSSWQTLDETFFTGGIGLPYTGQVVKLRFNAGSNPITEARMDNIKVEWS